MPTEEFPRGPVRRVRKGPGQGTTAPRQRETPQGKAGAGHTGRSLARVAAGPDRSRARGPANRLCGIVSEWCKSGLGVIQDRFGSARQGQTDSV